MDARLNTALASHPKTKKLIKRAGHMGAWHLVCLFLWAAANRSDGDLSGMSDEDIELAVDWAGDEGAFVVALADVRFLDGVQGARTIHDWAEHNPWAAGSEDRADASRWAALCKRYGRAGAADRMPDYATRMRPACDPHADAQELQCEPDAPSPSPSPSPSPEAKSKKTSAAPASAVALKFQTPDWIHPDVWGGFAEMRKRIRKPLTNRACALICTELIRLRGSGNDPNLVLDQSTRNSWQDVYEIKSGGNGSRGGSLDAVGKVQAAIEDRKQRERNENVQQQGFLPAA